MKSNLQVAGPELAQEIIGIVAMVLVAFASMDAICGGSVSGV